MPQKDPRVDAYIKASADFAKPILVRIRKAVHSGCPEVEETIRWGVPSFQFHGLLCNMAAFKEHCRLVFWKGSLLTSVAARGDSAEALFGRITSIQDLPPERALIAIVKQAAALNAQGVKAPSRPRLPARPVSVPADFGKALSRDAKARTVFDGFSASHRREYVEWITSAKTDATRQRRLETAVEWIGSGKSRNWKYERK